ncbi:MAG: hypothetical protein ABIE36_01170 [Candidatus Diapherotrites archaeon]
MESSEAKEGYKRVCEDMMNGFRKHHNLSKEVSENFSQVLWENPEQALNSLFDWYNESLDRAYTNSKTGENYRDFVEMVAGGPHEAIPSALYNSVGGIYPFLDRELKNKALSKTLGILDLQNYVNVQISHTPYIKEPLLLSDITIARGLYWPGMDEGKNRIKKFESFFDFKFEYMTKEGFFKKDLIDSDFIVAYSLLWKDFCNWGEEYLEVANPSFLERVLKGIVGMNFASSFKLKNLSEEEIKGINSKAEEESYYSRIKGKLDGILEKKISNRTKRLRELLPVSLYEKIDNKIMGQDWADPTLFWDPKD